MVKQIPILVPSVPQFRYLKPYLSRIDKSRIYSNFGPLNNELVARLGQYLKIDFKKIVTVNNATLGIQGAIMTIPGYKELNWGLPSWTFTATASASELSGIKYEFLDIDSAWRVRVNSNTNALIDVLPFGAGPDFGRVPKGIKYVVVDAAASFDAIKSLRLPTDKPVGMVFSMHATKLLPAGEGGFFVTNNAAWADRFRSWTNFGMNESRNSVKIGTNAKMSEFSCAVGLASLDCWKETRASFLDQRKKVLNLSQKFSLNSFNYDINELVTPYWILKFQNSDLKKKLIRILNNDKISHRNWWEKGCHNMPAYRHVKHGPLINTQIAAETSLGLPFHTFLNQSDWKRIETALNKLFAQ
jgi:dTDP-4-amino-4,6-dideoxygalactose transaminase